MTWCSSSGHGSAQELALGFLVAELWKLLGQAIQGAEVFFQEVSRGVPSLVQQLRDKGQGGLLEAVQVLGPESLRKKGFTEWDFLRYVKTVIEGQVVVRQRSRNRREVEAITQLLETLTV